MKPLMQVSAADVAGVTRALRAALEGGPTAPAVWPLAEPERARPTGEPTWVVDERIALVVETSGSTDAPKRVLLSAEALRASAAATEAALSGPGQWLLTLPAHYIAGAQVLARSIVAGTEPVVLEGEHFDPAAFAAASARLDRRVPRYTSLVPVQLSRLIDAARTDRKVADALHAFDRILLGGQAASASLILAADTLGVRITRTYGSSETAGGCVYDGRPLDGVRLRILDGGVELSGPMLADGYLGDPERTAAAFSTDANGTRWYRTGDLGELTHDGTLRIRGRAERHLHAARDDHVVGAVERAVRTVHGFGDAMVARMPAAEWGERAAVVAPRTDAAAASDALTTLAAATDAAGLTPAARPVRLELVDRMPLLATGKPDRRALESRLRDGGSA